MGCSKHPGKDKDMSRPLITEQEYRRFENIIFNDRNRHQANLMQCCSRPEEFLVELKKLMDFGGLLYTTETELDKKWDFYKAIYRTYITNDFLDNMDFEIGDLKVGAIYAFLITSRFSFESKSEFGEKVTIRKLELSYLLFTSLKNAKSLSSSKSRVSAEASTSTFVE